MCDGGRLHRRPGVVENTSGTERGGMGWRGGEGIRRVWLRAIYVEARAHPPSTHDVRGHTTQTSLFFLGPGKCKATSMHPKKKVYALLAWRNQSL